MTSDTSTPESTFQLAVATVLRFEGGHVNDPFDKGGETRFGISQRSYPELNISQLTKEQAIEIYRRDYWDQYHCASLPVPLALFIFDCQVQHRPRTGPRLLQSALRDGLRIDGYIGPATLISAQRANLTKLMPELFALRADLYHDLTLANSSQERFLMGWFRRLFMLHQVIERLN